MVVTLPEAKLHLRVDIADDDPLITALIEAATDYCEKRTGWSLVQRAWVVELSGFPSNGGEIVVPIAPLVSVTSMSFISPSNVSVPMTDGTDYRVSTALQTGRIRMPLGGSAWLATASIPDAVTIVVQAGCANAGVVPNAFRQSIKLLVGHWYENREAVSGDAGQAVDLTVASLLSLYDAREMMP